MMTFVEFLRFAGEYPGYPRFLERTAVDRKGYQKWVDCGRPAGLVTELYDHPDYLEGLYKGRAVKDDGSCDLSKIAFAPSIAGEYPRDGRGRPVHPYAEEILAAGLALEGPGAYWQYGPNLCADPIVLGVGRDGKLRTFAIERSDTGHVALPGGHLDPGESPMMAAMREFTEETSVELYVNSLIRAENVMDYLVPDPRTTLNAWPETSVWVFVVGDNLIDKMQPRASSDAANAWCKVLDDEFYHFMNAGHAIFVREAVRWFEEEFEVIVCDDGYVDANQD